MKRYYWFDWMGSHALWAYDGHERRCLFRTQQDATGDWVVNSHMHGPAMEIGRYKLREHAVARMTIELKFPDEKGETK